MLALPPPRRRPSAASALLALILWSACGGAMPVLRVTTEPPLEVWLPDPASDYLKAQGFTVSLLENANGRIRISATREVVDVRSVVIVTMQTQFFTGIHDNAAQTHNFKAEIQALRYQRDADGHWSPTDPEPLRGLADELANVIKTGS
jgi:hypothetical protein